MTREAGFAPLTNGPLHYEKQGYGPPILLLHAGVADGRMWDAQMDALTPHFTTVRFDLRGFGRSPWPAERLDNIGDVTGLLDHFGFDRAALVGISFGGLIALDVALAHPARVSALVLGAPGVSGRPPSDQLRALWAAEDEALATGDLAAATELNLRLWVDGPHRQPDEVDAEVRRRVGEMQRAAFETVEPEALEEVELTPPAYERLGAVAAPTLVMVGDLDLPDQIARSEEIAAGVPGAQLMRIPGVAHMLNMEAPDKFNTAVVRFLKSQMA